ncbi:MAG: MFS transporter [Acidobacteria bacterium]|nr:MFS transporter [Acidobacteriota bacterium]
MRARSRRWLILASALLSFFSVGLTFFAVPPLVPQLMARFGLDNLQVGLLMGAIALPAIFLSIPLGAAVDRWNARPAGTTGLATMAIGATLFALATSYPVLLVGRLLFGVGGLVMNLVLARLVSQAFAGRELSLAMGLFNAVYPASMIVIFSFHHDLLRLTGWRGELGILAAVVLVALPLHLLAVPSEAPIRTPAALHRGRGDKRLSRPLVMLAGSWMFFFAAFASVFTFAPQWAGGGTKGLVTVTAITWVSLLCNPLVGHLIDRFGGPAVWAGAGQAILAAALVLMAVGLLPPLAAMLLIGVAAAAVPTAVYSLPSRIVSPAQIGFAFGFITAFSNLGTLVGPAAAGAIRDVTASWSPLWLALAAVAAIGAIITPLRIPKHNGPGNGSDTPS